MSTARDRESMPSYAFAIMITCIMLVELMLLVKLFKSGEVAMPLITAIVIFGILLIVAPRQIQSIKFKGLLIELKDRTDQLTDNVADHVMASMSNEVYIQLELIANNDVPRAEMGESFRRELGYLDVLGYIEFPYGGLAGLNDGETYDMNNMARVTELGRTYIRLREIANKRINERA